MRRFHSYGPVDHRKHFTVPRTELVRSCAESLIGDPEEGGRYFTIWAPRQTGKTWLIRQVKEKIEQSHQNRFAVQLISFGDLRGMEYAPTGGAALPQPFVDLLEIELPGHPVVKTWKDFRRDADMGDGP